MNLRITLPTDKKEMVETIKRLLSDGDSARNLSRVEWLMSYLYLQGYRNFSKLDFATGTVGVTVESSGSNQSDFVFERILDPYNQMVARLMQMQIDPITKPRSMGLDALKKASVAQVVLNELQSEETSEKLKQKMIPMFVMCGHVGLGTFVTEDGPAIEVIPPWEVVPIPGKSISGVEIQAYVRERWVSYDELVKNGVLGKREDKKDLNLVDAQFGTGPDQQVQIFSGGNKSNDWPNETGGKKGKKGTKKTSQWAHFVEMWVYNENGYLGKYVQVVGDKVIKDVDYSERVPMPVSFARMLDVGGAYGRSHMPSLVNLNMEAEYMLESQFRNVEDFDLYGLSLFSSNMGVSREDVAEARDGNKTIFYSPDPLEPRLTPIQWEPTNSGKWPIEIVSLCMSLMSSQIPQNPMMQGDAPGRVDSASALGLLQESSNIPLVPATSSLSSMLVDAYRSLVWLARDQWEDGKVVEMTLMDDVLVGVTFDAVSGQVQLDKSSIPHPDEVQINIKSQNPKSPSQLEMELKESYANQTMTLIEFQIKVRELGLSYPVGGEEVWQNYRRAKLENIQLFNDGVTPGEVTVSQDDNHDVHLMVLQAFRARPEYMLSAKPVQSAFTEHFRMHQEQLGGYPEGMAYPEDVGMEEQAMMEQMPQ